MTTNLDARTLHQLQILGAKLQNNPAYMAWVIDVYQKQENISTYRLLEILQISENVLAKLKICKRPDTSGADFGKQSMQISEYTGVDLLKLVTLIRQVDSVDAFSGDYRNAHHPVTNLSQASFIAARDNSDRPSNEKNITLKKNKEEDQDVVD